MKRIGSMMLAAAMAALVFAPIAARAESEAVEAAEYAVRRAVRARMGDNYRVAFENPSERFLSFSETIVEGKGHTYSGDSWEFEESFDFFVKAKNDGSGTRDMKITFSSGKQHVSGSNWETVETRNDYVHLVRPKWYQRFDTGRITFEGESRDTVTITVFDKKNRKVGEGSARSSGGRFSTTLDLPEGQLRALVQSRGSSEYDEVRFSVSDDGHDWGTPAPSLRLDEPSRNAVIKGSSVRISGNSNFRFVKIRVWDDRSNKPILERDAAPRYGNFSLQTSLDEGDYRITVEAGSARETRTFRVWSQNHPHDEGRAYVRIQEPSNYAVIRDPRVTIAGTSSARSVRVTIMDDRNNRIEERNVPTRGNYWNTQITLSDGSYRAVVNDGSGGAGEQRSFRVDANKKKPAVNLIATVRVTDPKRDGIAKGPRVTVAGNSSERSVRVQVWDSRNNRVTDRNVPTQNDYFNTQIPLESGRYRVRVDAASGRDYEEFWFTVK